MPSVSWSPASWRQRPIRQQPTYADPEAAVAALRRVAALPPLVAPGEIVALRAHLARAAAGEAFVLQGGDCAERFEDCARGPIEAKLKILLQMSLVLTWGARIPVIRVARFAGQYAKPRSSDTEVVDGVELPTYRGDHVNGMAATLDARRPDPERLVAAYFHSAATLNYARALLDGGFADLHEPRHWDLGFVRSVAARAHYEEIVERLLDALEFVESTGIPDAAALRTVELFSSHEGLLLPYEETLTRRVGDAWYNLSAHTLWIGDRTRQRDGAHVEYFRGIQNPVGVKLGPGATPDELLELLAALEPENRPGRVTLVTRLGAGAVGEHLGPLVEAVQRAGRAVIWSCDPMHGNTESSAQGIKTRRVARVLQELRETFDVHEQLGSRLGGVHFELTGEDVTECMGGPQELSEADLARNYDTGCDPRLNYAQSLEMAFLLSERLRRQRAGA